MKKAILFLLALIILSLVTNASDGRNSLLLRQPAGNGCFDENTHIINLGIGFGGIRYYYGSLGSGYTYKSSPAFSLTYEQAWPKKLGPGYLGVGGYLGYKHSSSRYEYTYWNNNSYGNYYYEHNWNYYMLAARGVYHWDVLNAKNAEVYGGVLIGVRITTYSYSTNDTYYTYKRSDSGVMPVYSLFAGARWYFVPKVALFGEIGYGVSYFTGGVSFKF